MDEKRASEAYGVNAGDGITLQNQGDKTRGIDHASNVESKRPAIGRGHRSGHVQRNRQRTRPIHHRHQVVRFHEHHGRKCGRRRYSRRNLKWLIPPPSAWANLARQWRPHTPRLPPLVKKRDSHRAEGAAPTPRGPTRRAEQEHLVFHP
jgi:hypothetical protein